WLELAETVEGAHDRGPERLSDRMLDRLGQLVPRLTFLGGDWIQIDGLADLRVGSNVLVLRRELKMLEGKEAAAANTVLSGVAEFYRQRLAEGPGVRPSDGLLEMVDRALLSSVLAKDSRRRQLISAVAGIRRALFPHAPPPAIPTSS